MAKKEKLTTSQIDGVEYKRAKMWQIALSQLTGAGQMCFYMLMTYATYIGNVNYGICSSVTGPRFAFTVCTTLPSIRLFSTRLA